MSNKSGSAPSYCAAQWRRSLGRVPDADFAYQGVHAHAHGIGAATPSCAFQGQLASGTKRMSLATAGFVWTFRYRDGEA
jgi:hypothetical protein